MSLKSLDQERAAFAWKCALDGKSDKYVNLAKSAPALIMQNGLMQTLAFLEGKGKDEHKAIVRHIVEWLRDRQIVDRADFGAAMAQLHGGESDRYMRATDEALEILRWIRQFAPAICDGKGDR